MKKRKKYGFNYTIVENVSMTQNKQIWIVKKKLSTHITHVIPEVQKLLHIIRKGK